MGEAEKKFQLEYLQFSFIESHFPLCSSLLHTALPVQIHTSCMFPVSLHCSGNQQNKSEDDREF